MRHGERVIGVKNESTIAGATTAAEDELMTVDEYVDRYVDLAVIEAVETRDAARLLDAEHMTMREFVAAHAPALLDDFDTAAADKDGNDDPYARSDEWMDRREAGLGLTPTHRPCGARVFHVALLDHRLEHMASFGS